MKTDHPLLPLLFPETWAESYGQDRYGLWQGVHIEDIELRFRWIPPGEFMMGSPPDEPERRGNEGPQHQVRFAQGFWLAETACPQALWQAVMGENPSKFKSEENPVENISWNDAQRFIEKINRLYPGLELRLPSEAEWEYACRAGTTTRYWFGDEIDHSKANYGQKNEGTVPVKRYPRNPWGLYQMHGNVWEWCEDHWHDSYEDAPEDGRPWLTGGDQERAVLRGGSWFLSGRGLWSAYRDHAHRAVRGDDFGFRLARGPERQPVQPSGAGAASGQPERGTSEADPTQRRRG